MIHLTENHPIEDVKSVLKDEYVWPFVSEDGQYVESYNPIDDGSVNYLGIMSDDRNIGVFVTHSEGLSTVKAHIAILKPYRMVYAVEAVKRLIEWFISLSDRVIKLNAEIPEYNYGAIRLASRCGFIAEGINRKSIMRDGNVYDQFRFGITKTEAKELCQQHYQAHS